MVLTENITACAKDEHSAKVMIVEDEVSTLKLITKYFESLNYEVISTDCPSKALKILGESEGLDLLVLDVIMPELSGFEVCRKVREKYSMFELPVIFITAMNDVDAKVAGFESGCNDIVTKPFNSHEMIARAKNLVKLKKLTEKNEVLQSAIDLKNKFIRMNVHDLKNPMTTISLLAEMLKNNCKSTDEEHEELEIILQSSKKVLDLVNELLEYSKIESGKVTINKSPSNFTDVVAAAIENNLPGARRKSQSICHAKECSADLVLNIDMEKIFRAVDNLISNAVKYSPSDTEIEAKTLLIKAGRNREVVRFEVKDNGPGLQPEETKQLFTAFGTLSTKPTGGESSSGLGLVIAKHFIEMHDGKIWAESEPGRGSKFIFEIPAEFA